MRPTSWLIRVMMACWQCGHTVCTGADWNISPCSTVTVVAVPGGPITVAVCPIAGPQWLGPGTNCPGMGWGKCPGGGWKPAEKQLKKKQKNKGVESGINFLPPVGVYQTFPSFIVG